MAAKATGVKLEEVAIEADEAAKLLPSGATLPALETAEGQILSQTPAILSYVCYGHEIAGKSPFQAAQVTQWLNYLRHETWPLAKGINAYVFGQLECPGESEHVFLYAQLKENIKVLNNSLKGKEWLVGDCMTVADLQLALCIVELQQCTMDTNFRNSINNLNAHFKRVTESALFRSRCGIVKQGKKQLLPSSMNTQKEAKVKVAKGKK